jgi:hypothetical protein
MTTSGDNSFPRRLTKIDELTRGDHNYLVAGDECLFFGDYSARLGFSHSATNQLIHNFKMPVQNRGTNRWRHKTAAINSAAQALSQNLGSAFSRITLVPVPPSKLRSDSEYDDRVMDMLRALRAPDGSIVDVRELVLQTHPMAAAHTSTSRPPPGAWEDVYAIDEELTKGVREWIGIVDDVLVTGCRFRAMSNVLKRRFSSTRITGLFLARRVPTAADISAFVEPIDD